jgi:hypothetical protein
MKIKIISITEKNTIFESTINSNKEISFDFFSLKMVTNDKFILTDSEKKKIIHTNEIFNINNFEYLILNNESPISIIKNINSKKNNFNQLSENSIYNLIIFIIKKINKIQINENKKNHKIILKYFKIIILILILITSKNIKYDELSKNNFEIKKNIYTFLKNSESNSISEKTNKSLYINEKIINIEENINKSNKEINVIKNKEKSNSTFQKKLNINTKEKIDEDVEYFFNIKNKKK